jgi:hypothetical protein
MAMQEPLKEPGPLGKLLALLVGAMLLVLGFMFSVVILAAVVVVGLAAFGWFWWKTRELRKVLREQAEAQAAQAAYGPAPADGEIIEGEAIVVEEVRRERDSLPR